MNLQNARCNDKYSSFVVLAMTNVRNDSFMWINTNKTGNVRIA